jgi:hypothetical protein
MKRALVFALVLVTSLTWNNLGAQPTEPTLLSISSDPFLINTLYKDPTRMVHGVAADGAIGVNADWEQDPTKPWYIEEQRYGADLIQVGLAKKDDSLIEQGITVINWGFDHEGDGSFPGTGDPHHSISFFLEAASRSVILLQQANDPAHLAELKDWKGNIQKAADWMITPTVFPKNRAASMDPYTHRFFLCAAALGEAGVVTGASRFQDAALQLAQAGLPRQQPDGTDPEKGGFDVNYQAVGVLFATRYLLVCSDPPTQAQLRQLIAKALEKERTMISATGEVSLDGSTRITSENARSGKKKTMDYKTLAQALIFWSDLSGDASCREAAESIAQNKHW